MGRQMRQMGSANRVKDLGAETLFVKTGCRPHLSRCHFKAYDSFRRFFQDRRGQRPRRPAGSIEAAAFKSSTTSAAPENPGASNPTTNPEKRTRQVTHLPIVSRARKDSTQVHFVPGR